ncbi:MAG: hypothetical protein ABI361_06380 [Nitrososphaera sp.]|jgi:rubredoxin
MSSNFRCPDCGNDLKSVIVPKGEVAQWNCDPCQNAYTIEDLKASIYVP